MTEVAGVADIGVERNKFHETPVEAPWRRSTGGILVVIKGLHGSLLMVTHIVSGDQRVAEVLVNQFLWGKAGSAWDDLDAVFSKKG